MNHKWYNFYFVRSISLSHLHICHMAPNSESLTPLYSLREISSIEHLKQLLAMRAAGRSTAKRPLDNDEDEEDEIAKFIRESEGDGAAAESYVSIKDRRNAIREQIDGKRAKRVSADDDAENGATSDEAEFKSEKIELSNAGEYSGQARDQTLLDMAADMRRKHANMEIGRAHV